MSPRLLLLACSICAFQAMPLSWAAAPAPAPARSAAAQALMVKYEADLKALRAELAGAIPKLDAGTLTQFQATQKAVKEAEAQVAKSRDGAGKVSGAKGLVEHAKGKWIGGADKGIAAAQAALGKASTDAERTAAQKDLEKWQANRQDGVNALKERQAAYDLALAGAADATRLYDAAKASLEQAKAAEQATAKVLLTAADTFLNTERYEAKLVKCAVLANATPGGLADFAVQGSAQAALVERLLADGALMKAMLVAGGPEGGKYGQAMQIFSAILQASPRAQDGQFRRLALATALEHAVPIAQTNNEALSNAPATVDPVKRYRHFETAALSGDLDSAFKDFSVWEYRNVINGDENEETLTWGREMLRNYRPDHVLNPDYGWRYSRAVATDVRYGSQNVKNDDPALHKYQNIIRNGGVCGRRAFFGRFILRSFGIPTVARPQRGHAALAHWTPTGWVINLGAGWGNPDAKGVMEMTDADFVLETQVRKQPLVHEKSLRAQWVGEALAEPRYVSLKPGPAGQWNLLSLFVKRTVGGGTKGLPMAALGAELGEANESAEVRARALVKSVITPADKKVTTAANGVITIPAAACSGAQVVGSFQGGQQLFSGGGVIKCDFELPAAGQYKLTARVSTVQDNPKVLLAANNLKTPVEMVIPYTVGKWQQTPEVTVALIKGKNTLQFNRPEGSRGLTIKEFTLTPVN